MTLILVAVLMSFGLRRALAIYKWLFALSIIGVAIAFVVLIVNGRSDFRSAVGHYGGNYDGIIAAAKKTGLRGQRRVQPRSHHPGHAARLCLLRLRDRHRLRGQRDPLARSRQDAASMVDLARHLRLVVAILMALASRTFGNDFLGSATVSVQRRQQRRIRCPLRRRSSSTSRC